MRRRVRWSAAPFSGVLWKNTWSSRNGPSTNVPRTTWVRVKGRVLHACKQQFSKAAAFSRTARNIASGVRSKRVRRSAAEATQQGQALLDYEAPDLKGRSQLLHAQQPACTDGKQRPSDACHQDICDVQSAEQSQLCTQLWDSAGDLPTGGHDAKRSKASAAGSVASPTQLQRAADAALDMQAKLTLQGRRKAAAAHRGIAVQQSLSEDSAHGPCGCCLEGSLPRPLNPALSGDRVACHQRAQSPKGSIASTASSVGTPGSAMASPKSSLGSSRRTCETSSPVLMVPHTRQNMVAGQHFVTAFAQLHSVRSTGQRQVMASAGPIPAQLRRQLPRAFSGPAAAPSFFQLQAHAQDSTKAHAVGAAAQHSDDDDDEVGDEMHSPFALAAREGSVVVCVQSSSYCRREPEHGRSAALATVALPWTSSLALTMSHSQLLQTTPSFFNMAAWGDSDIRTDTVTDDGTDSDSDESHLSCIHTEAAPCSAQVMDAVLQGSATLLVHAADTAHCSTSEVVDAVQSSQSSSSEVAMVAGSLHSSAVELVHPADSAQQDSAQQVAATEPVATTILASVSSFDVVTPVLSPVVTPHASRPPTPTPFAACSVGGWEVQAEAQAGAPAPQQRQQQQRQLSACSADSAQGSVHGEVAPFILAYQRSRAERHGCVPQVGYSPDFRLPGTVDLELQLKGVGPSYLDGFFAQKGLWVAKSPADEAETQQVLLHGPPPARPGIPRTHTALAYRCSHHHPADGAVVQGNGSKPMQQGRATWSGNMRKEMLLSAAGGWQRTPVAACGESEETSLTVAAQATGAEDALRELGCDLHDALPLCQEISDHCGH